MTDRLEEGGAKPAAWIGGIFLGHDVSSEERWKHVVVEAPVESVFALLQKNVLTPVLGRM
ncbi:hypothetical protein ACQPZ2_29600 [Nocardia pseudovaccinii]|uniref:hypothetical protein n=1 Tax=Nocardia pseudovaccinii TaxID=189540 RepID=UPI003D8E98FE